MTGHQDLIEQLRNAWCKAFDVFEQSGELHLSTPFLYDDGDVLPLILQPTADGWKLTDRGNGVARLGYDDSFDLTAATEANVRRIIEAGGHPHLENYEIVTELPDVPTPYDLADFLQTVIQLGSLSAIHQRVQTERFVASTRRVVETRVPEANRTMDWFPKRVDGELFPTDALLRMTAGDDVYLWLVGDASKAERAMTSVGEYRTWDLPGRPVMGQRFEAIGSKTSRRARRIFNGRVFSVPVGEPNRLLELLAEQGVPVLAA